MLKQWLDEADISDPVKFGLHILLIVATSSVVFGRFYCVSSSIVMILRHSPMKQGMHSSLDCIGGVITGYLIYLTRSLIGPYYKAFISHTSWFTPFSLTVLSVYQTSASLPLVHSLTPLNRPVCYTRTRRTSRRQSRTRRLSCVHISLPRQRYRGVVCQYERIRTQHLLRDEAGGVGVVSCIAAEVSPWRRVDIPHKTPHKADYASIVTAAVSIVAQSCYSAEQKGVCVCNVSGL